MRLNTINNEYMTELRSCTSLLNILLYGVTDSDRYIANHLAAKSFPGVAMVIYHPIHLETLLALDYLNPA